MAKLPAIMISVVGTDAMKAMADALDNIISADVHAVACGPSGVRDCGDECPVRIARGAVETVGNLTNIAVTAGG